MIKFTEWFDSICGRSDADVAGKQFEALKRQSKKNDVLIVGSNGMLGSYLLKQFHENAALKDSVIRTAVGVDVPFDITQLETLREYFRQTIHFDYVINCAAITDTTKCEKEQYDLSYIVNAVGPRNLAVVCKEFGMKLIHISTDYVWSENSYQENPPVEFPVNAYGVHKLLGEKYIQEIFGEECEKEYAILRTSWLYGVGKSTFIHKIIANALDAVEALCPEYAYEADIPKNHIECQEARTASIQVTGDNFGKPTSVNMACKFILNVIRQEAYGIMDMQYLGDPISRYEFAQVILTACERKSRPDFKTKLKLEKVSSSSFKTPIRHPKELRNNEGLGCETIPTCGYDVYCKLFDDECTCMQNLNMACKEIEDFIDENENELVEYYIKHQKRLQESKRG